MRLLLAILLAVLLFRMPEAAAAPPAGAVWSWGGLEFGFQGSGAIDNGDVPRPTRGVSDVTSVSGGLDYTLAVKSDGTVWAWGNNDFGQYGDGSTDPSTAPVRSTKLSGVAGVAAGSRHALALETDGTVWAWGSNDAGQLGDGTVRPSLAPARVPSLTRTLAVAAGPRFSLALEADGIVRAWGDNGFGQLGRGSTEPLPDALGPTPVAGLTGVVAIAAGYRHALALKSDGTVWAWGNDDSGELGDGAFTTQATPVPVAGLSDVAAIAAGLDFSLALRSDGTVWAWGSDSYGQTGQLASGAATAPTRINDLGHVTAISAGLDYGLALRSDGTVWSWGADSTRIKSSDQSAFPTPAQVGCFRNALAIFAGPSHSMAIASDNPNVTLSPTSVDYGTQPAGGGATARTVTITNNGSAPLFVYPPAILGTNAPEFSLIGNSCPSDGLCPGQACALQISFTPSGTGDRQAHVEFTANSQETPVTIPLTGTGVTPIVELDRGAMNFGTQPIHSSGAPQSVRVANRGTAPLVISGLTMGGDGADDFRVIGMQLPLSVPAGGAVILNVAFDPTLLGSRNAGLALVDNAMDSPQVVSLEGAGSLEITPGSLSLGPGDSKSFAVYPDTVVVWSVQGPGIMESNGVYHAPDTLSADQDVTITAAAADATLSSSIIVHLLAPLTITAKSQRLAAGEEAPLTVNVKIPVVWSVDGGSSAGSIDASGLYRAPGSLDADRTVTVRAAATDGSGRAGAATLTLLAPLRIDASTLRLTAGSQSRLTTNSAAPVSWAVGGGDGDGTIDSSGVYTAPAVIAADRTMRINATATDGSGRTATLTLTLATAPLPGDVTGDGRIDVRDALAILAASVGTGTLTPVQRQIADVNGDGKVDVRDAVRLMRIAVGLERG